MESTYLPKEILKYFMAIGKLVGLMFKMSFSFGKSSVISIVNPFVPNAPFLYPRR